MNNWSRNAKKITLTAIVSTMLAQPVQLQEVHTKNQTKTLKQTEPFYIIQKKAYDTLIERLKSDEDPWRTSPLPVGKINYIQSLDDTPQAKRYNNIDNPEERNDTILERGKGDWVRLSGAIVPSNLDWPWACGQISQQFIINCKNFGENAYQWDRPLYNGNKGPKEFNSQAAWDTLFANGGTQRDMGKLGLPMCTVTIYDPVTMPEGHAMCAILTGDDPTKLENWKLYEPQNGLFEDIGVGTLSSLTSFQKLIISHYFTYPNNNSDNNIQAVPLFMWSKKEGEAPKYEGSNPYIAGQIIMNRSELQTPIQENTIDKAIVYPTRFDDQITIKNNTLTPQKVWMYDQLGRQILERTKREKEYNIHDQVLKALGPGYYLLQLGEGKDKEVYKLIKTGTK
jgi:hypothetical protein